MPAHKLVTQSVMTVPNPNLVLFGQVFGSNCDVIHGFQIFNCKFNISLSYPVASLLSNFQALLLSARRSLVCLMDETPYQIPMLWV
jgi:hypothetical protein